MFVFQKRKISISLKKNFSRKKKKEAKDVSNCFHHYFIQNLTYITWIEIFNSHYRKNSSKWLILEGKSNRFIVSTW